MAATVRLTGRPTQRLPSLSGSVPQLAVPDPRRHRRAARRRRDRGAAQHVAGRDERCVQRRARRTRLEVRLDHSPLLGGQLVVEVVRHQLPGVPAPHRYSFQVSTSLGSIGQRRREHHPPAAQALLRRGQSDLELGRDLGDGPADHVVEHDGAAIVERQPGESIAHLVPCRRPTPRAPRGRRCRRRRASDPRSPPPPTPATTAVLDRSRDGGGCGASRCGDPPRPDTARRRRSLGRTSPARDPRRAPDRW